MELHLKEDEVHYYMQHVRLNESLRKLHQS